MIYFAFIYPHLLYGIEVYANTTLNRLAKLITLNNKLLRVLQNKPLRTYVHELYRSYLTLPVNLLHDFQILVFMHTYVHHKYKLPSVFATYLEENKFIHHYNTRQKDDFHSRSVHSDLGKRNIKYKAVDFGMVYLLT